MRSYPRSAHASIYGYLYQTYLGILRWLDLGEGEVLVFEGDEDLDRLLLHGVGVSEQVKALERATNLRDRKVLDSLRNFLLIYHPLREAGEDRRFVFTTTAEQRPQRTQDLVVDVLAAWEDTEQRSQVVEALRKLLPKSGEKAQGKTQAKALSKALEWLDQETDGSRWDAFIDSVTWDFNAPKLPTVRGQIASRLGARPDAASFPAETLIDRLLAEVFQRSSRDDPAERTRASQDLAAFFAQVGDELAAWAAGPSGVRLRTVLRNLDDLGPLLENPTRPRGDFTGNPGKVLRAAYEVIPFEERPRAALLEELAEWCADPQPSGVFLLTGEGGSGKTRLLIEWCQRLGTQGWLVGFLPGMRAGREPDPRPLLQGELPRLVVLDYAETRLELVRTFLRDLALHQNGPKLRVVLLARRVADWWRSLQTDDDIDDLLARALVRKITPLTEAGKDRRESFQHCLEVFGARLTQGVPDRPWPDLEDAKYDRALYLHMAALAFLFGVAVHDADEALQWTLKHERDFWDKEIEREKLDGPTRRDLEETLPNLLAVVTLLGGCADRDRALDLAQRVVEPSRLARTAVDLLRRLYSGEEGAEEIFLEGLQPDLLGEELVRQRLQAKPALLSLALDAAEAEEEKVQILTVLTRLAQRVEAAVVWLDEAFAGPRLELLARVAPLVAVATGDPIGQRLARALSDQVPTKVLEGIVGLCEEPSLQKSVPLLELAAVATRLLVDRMPTGEFVENEKSRARLLHNLGVRLSALGLRREALAASCEATQIYRRLSVVEPHAFLPDLAMSLDSLGIRLSELGRRKEALAASSEATQLYRRLLEWNRNAFLPDLARSLNNQGIRLSELGREEKALAASKEATGLYRRLLERDGDAFLPDLARSLHNLGARLSQAGFHSQALAALEEATQAYRDLSGLRPDVFLPELASSLDNLGIVLGSLNRRSEAVAASREATQLYRVLSNSRPGAFLSDLAMSLSNLGNRLSDLDRHREALSASEESAQLYRLLAKSNRGAFVPDLARSLQNLGLRLFDVGCLEEALAAYKEAIVLLSPSFFQLPEAYAFWMGKMLGNYFQACSEAEAEPDGDLIGPIVELMDELDSASSEDDEEPAEQELAAEGGEEE